ncbi:BC1872 family protein [Neobacillus sp. Marseille-QA0830]
MNKIEVIARRILGWKLNGWDKWYDYEKNMFIHDFQPEQNLEHSMIIVERLKSLGFSYTAKGEYQVCFNDICSTGHSLAEAITNAAYSLADNSSIDEGWL